MGCCGSKDEEAPVKQGLLRDDDNLVCPDPLGEAEAMRQMAGQEDHVLGGNPDVVISTAYGPINVNSSPNIDNQFHVLALDSCTKYLVLTDTGFTASGVMSQMTRSPYHYMAVFLPKEDA